MSNQLPITVNQDQVLPLFSIIEAAMDGHDPVLEISQSRGPLFMWSIFVKVETDQGTETWAISHRGSRTICVTEQTEDNREPTDDEIYAREPMEPGVDEHDPRL